MISVHNCDYYKYADDTELSKSAPPDQFLSVQSCIETCIDDVLHWMNSNKLKLNTDKTEVTPVGSASCLESVDSECANIGGNSVPFQTSVKYLGVQLDRTLSMQKHISSICCASFLELRCIASIRPYLSQSAAARLVATMVTSRLDYCNSVFIGLPADQIAPLQRVQKIRGTARDEKRRRDHVSPLLKELHWLPVKFRCQYKIATLAYRHFEGSLPPYLSSSLCAYESSRSLRSSNQKLLKIPKRNLKSFGQRSFSFMASSLPATKKCTNAVSIQIAAKNLLVCPGLPVESEEMCVCVWQLNVDGCSWIGRGGKEGGGEYERSRQEKEARVRWVKSQIQTVVV